MIKVNSNCWKVLNDNQHRRFTQGENVQRLKVLYLMEKEKSVYQFDLQGNLVKCWKSASEASRNMNAEKLNSVRVAIQNCCNGKVNQAYGYFWSFKPKFEFKVNKSYVAVAKYNDEGKFLESYSSISEAARDCGLKSSGNIISCIKGKQKRCGGFRWRYFYGNTSDIPPLR